MGWLAEYRTTAILFALSIAVFVAMQGLFPRELAAPVPASNVSNPVLAFEFATEPAHLDSVFGGVADPRRAERITAMDAGNSLDYLYMPLYGLFVFSFLAAIGRELAQPVWRVVGALAIVAAIADAFENWSLLRLTADLADPAAELALLPYPVWIKFGLLALTCGAAAVALHRARRPWLALLCLPAPLLIFPGIWAPHLFGALAVSLIGLGWLAMGIHAIHRAFRSRVAQSV